MQDLASREREGKGGGGVNKMYSDIYVHAYLNVFVENKGA